MKTRAALEGEWWQYQQPFLHYRATEVFSQDMYEHMATRFRQRVDGARQRQPSFGRTAEYDADIIGLTAETAASFAPLLSERWMSGISSLLGLPKNGLVDAALHSSQPNSRTGWIHTDYCAAWFNAADKSSQATLWFPDRRACDYFTGRKKNPDARPVEYSRAATLIFYLSNESWHPGAGGETGLFAGAMGTGADYVAPLDNSLLLFACSPHSYHRFITNPGCTRNSIILWLHQTLDEATASWGVAPRRGSAK